MSFLNIQTCFSRHQKLFFFINSRPCSCSVSKLKYSFISQIYCVTVFYWSYCIGHGSRASWDSQWDPVCSSKQHQSQVTTLTKMCTLLFSIYDLDLPLIWLCLSSSLEVGSCIAVQVCMLQIPLLILFNAFYVSHTQ